MTLPTTYLAALVLSIFSMLCLGSWANSFKLVGKRRFELLYFDFALGLMLAVLVAAFTLGTMGSDGFTFMDDIMRAGKRNMVFALGAGVVFNLGNMLLVGGVSLVGMAVGFPLSLGLALMTAVAFSSLVEPQGNPTLVASGVGLVALAIIVDIVAYLFLSLHKEVQRMKAGEHRTLRPSVSWKGVLIAAVGGLVLGLPHPLLAQATRGDVGLGPYSTAIMFCLGIASSTVIFNLFFMNLPIQGPALEIPDYLRGKFRNHMIGLVGGVVWAAGTIAAYVAPSVPVESRWPPSVGFAVIQAAPLVSALWGLLAWKEIKGADLKVPALMVLMFLLFAGGLVVLSMAPFSLAY